MLCSNSVKPVVHGFKVEAGGGGGGGGGGRRGGEKGALSILFVLLPCAWNGSK